MVGVTGFEPATPTSRTDSRPEALHWCEGSWPTRRANARRRTDYGGSNAEYPKLGTLVSAHEPFCGLAHRARSLPEATWTQWRSVPN
jgi:hypothetical protein